MRADAIVPCADAEQTTRLKSCECVQRFNVPMLCGGYLCVVGSNAVCQLRELERGAEILVATPGR